MPVKGGTLTSSHLEKKHLHQSCTVIVINSTCTVNFICKLLVLFQFLEKMGLAHFLTSLKQRVA